MIFNPSIWACLSDAATNGVFETVGSGAPVNGTSGTGVGICGPGSTYTDIATGKVYVNTNTAASPTWTLGFTGVAGVDLSSIQTLTNKTLTAPVINNATGSGEVFTGSIINNQSMLNNFSTTVQSPSATVRTYITGSQIVVPTGKLQIGSFFEWEFNFTKNANGSASSTIDVAIGTNGTTGDAAVLSFTKPAGTAVADEGWNRVRVICRGPLSASGIFAGDYAMTHNLSATGHATIPSVNVNVISSAFDVTQAGLKLGICITTGAADAINIQTVTAKAFNL